MIAEVTQAIHRWEPRAEVCNVYPRLDSSKPGKMMPLVEVEISAEE